MVRSGFSANIPTATVEEYLDRLEEIVECAPTMPFTGKCVLDRKELSGLISAMRDVLHAESPSSTSRLHQQMRTDAFQPVGAAQRRHTTAQEEMHEEPFEEVSSVKEIIVPQEVTDQLADARTEAERIVEEAKQEAQRIRSGADEYAENALASVEQNALGAARAARKGLEVLQRRRSSGN